MAKNSGPPKVVCTECGQTVLKSTTRSIGDGKRACKFHDGVMEKAKKVEDQTKKTRQDKAKNEKNRWKNEFQKPVESSETMIKAELWANFTCWCCNKKGIQISHVFQRRLVAMEKLSLMGIPFNPLDVSYEMNLRDAMDIPVGTIFLNRFPLPEDKNERAKWLNMLHKEDRNNKRMVVPLVGFMQLCPECCKKFGVEFMPKTPTPTLEQLANLGAVYEATIGKKVKEQAAKEIFMEESPELLN